MLANVGQNPQNYGLFFHNRDAGALKKALMTTALLAGISALTFTGCFHVNGTRVILRDSSEASLSSEYLRFSRRGSSKVKRSHF